jgi:glycosyltransferase involved in cell wall biosynthesis
VLEELVKSYSRLHIISIEKNGGKGAAIFQALQQAQEEDFTHVLTMDADGQHPNSYIQKFLTYLKNVQKQEYSGNLFFLLVLQHCE